MIANAVIRLSIPRDACRASICYQKNLMAIFGRKSLMSYLSMDEKRRCKREQEIVEQDYRIHNGMFTRKIEQKGIAF